MEKRLFDMEVGVVLSAIRNRRTELGYSQEYVGSRIGMTQNAYSKVELGQSKLTLEHLYLLTKLLGLSVGTLLSEAWAARKSHAGRG